MEPFKIIFMFPAPAGMNRPKKWCMVFRGYVPRTRGDEPELMSLDAVNVTCSPHPRG